MTFAKCPRPLTVLLLAIVLAGCGGTAATARPTASLTASPTPSASSSPTASPSPSPADLSGAPIPVSALAPATTASPIRLDEATDTALQAALNSARSAQRSPALQAAIVFPDGSIWTGQSGVAVRSPSTPVTADTLFAVGSISKTIVAALTLRLAEQGTIHLDDRLSLYLPDYPNAARINIRQLLSHTSGVQDLFKAPGMTDAILANPTRIWTADQVLARIGSPYFAPGKGWRYSNTNYVILGEVIEKATGETVAELARQEFLGPLGLEHTYLQTQETVSGPLAHGYSNKGAVNTRALDSASEMIPFNSEVSACGPAGAYASTATDIARWGSALYGGAVLDDASLAAMVDFSVSAPFKPRTWYGLGFERRSLSGRWTWGHLGGLDGFTASMKYLPDLRLTIVVLANSDWASPASASSALLTALLAA